MVQVSKRILMTVCVLLCHGAVPTYQIGIGVCN